MKSLNHNTFDYIPDLLQKSESKIFYLVLDGLGGLPEGKSGHTALEAAQTPNMNELAAEGITGLHMPVAAGVTPGSGPGHLGIFGYDPLVYNIGRGVLAAAGIDFGLQDGDVAARGNFCTVDEDGNVTDRRAGRISTDENQRLVQILRQIRIDEGEVRVETVKEHRFLLVLRGTGLSDGVADTDPQKTGLAPHEPKPLRPEAEKTARCMSQFVARAGEALKNEPSANMVLLRGCAAKPDLPPFHKVFGLKAAALANYPMYRGLARLLGMQVFPDAEKPQDKGALVRENLADYDFFFVHVKGTDKAGEDGDFQSKVEAIEAVDELVKILRGIDPGVFVITGDHSTPARLKSHSWHPVPVLLWSHTCRPDPVREFGEAKCVGGALGPRFPATGLMPLALAHARRLKKFGA